MSPKQVWRLLTETFQEWNEDKVIRLAAALSYFAIFSLAPLLIMVIAIAGFFFGEDAARGEIVGQLQGALGAEGAQFIETAIDNAAQVDTNGTLASLISLGILIFAASGLFIQLQESLNTIWNVEPAPEGGAVKNFVSKRILSFLMIVLVGVLLLLFLVSSAVLAGIITYADHLLPGAGPLWQALNLLVSLGFITLMFAILFKYLPDAEIAWGDVWIGSLITAILFVLGQWLIGLYLGSASVASAYGAAGSLVVVLLWINYSSLVFFTGAEFTQVYARRYGSRIVPAEHAVEVETHKVPRASGAGADASKSGRGGDRQRRRQASEGQGSTTWQGRRHRRRR